MDDSYRGARDVASPSHHNGGLNVSPNQPHVRVHACVHVAAETGERKLQLDLVY